MNGATVRFGHFELDLTELRYRGRRRKLERLPMDLLHLLIERRGDLVSRDEIAERLWGKTVFVETENNINAAIRKIRRALNDAPDHPKFVQTVTRRGYRFIAPAGPVASSESTSGSATALGTPSPDGP